MTENATRGAYARTRPVIVVDDLAQLTGPTSGIVHLPPHLYWGPNPLFDITDVARRRWLYSIVLSEALDPADLGEFVNATLLASEWESIVLPDRVRRQWERRFPTLSE